MQRAGHRPIVLLGGGTTMVGDPSGKTDMRKMLSVKDIDSNAENFKKQLSRFIDFTDDKALMVNNADWLRDLNYLEFLREVGANFSVNRMLGAECFKSRMEKGLSFLEFNYMIMQAYDFYVLNEKYGCKMEMGGDDQWSNIIAGSNLIRRKSGKPAFGMTFTLLTTSEGKKMGKTEKGALWLDPEKTSPYEFFQYWRNVADADVERCLSLLTFLPMDEVRRLSALEGAEINKAKEILAFEVTKLVHGEEEATKSLEATKALFGKGPASANVPSTEMISSEFTEGIGLLKLLCDLGLTPSVSEARRLVKQGGVSLNGEKVTDFKYEVTLNDFKDNELMIKKGKKTYHQVKISE
jgi:tyrosyl-tRNA synthetase